MIIICIEQQTNMNIQQQSNPTIVMDIGSSYCRAGFAGEDSPKYAYPCVVGQPKYPGTMIGLTQTCYIGQQAEMKKGILKIRNPIQYGVANSWDDLIKILQHCYKDELKINAPQQPCLMTQPTNNPKQNREKITQIMFEHFQVPSFCLAKQAELVFMAQGRTTGLVVDLGHTISYVTAISEGKIISQANHANYMGGRDLTQYLSKLLQQIGFDFSTAAEMEIVKDIKQKLCYISVNYQAQMEKAHAGDIKSTYQLPDGQVFSIETQKFRCPQILFKPSMIGKQMYGIHEICYKSIMKCNQNLRETIYQNIVLCGGSSMFPGLKERLTKQIKQLAPHDANIKILATPQRKYSAWIGGSIVASLSDFANMTIKRSEYEEQGVGIVHKKCI